MRPLHLQSTLLIALALGASSSCSSTAPKPTLPAPEFEPPEVLPWDAGATPVMGATPDDAAEAGDHQSSPAEPQPPRAEPASAEPGPTSSPGASSSAPLAEPQTSVKIAPTP